MVSPRGTSLGPGGLVVTVGLGLADVHRVFLTLVPRPLDPKNDYPHAPPDRNAPDAEALEAFYERLGFERSGGEFEGSPVLVRSPR